jgi:hypothetical protein
MERDDRAEGRGARPAPDANPPSAGATSEARGPDGRPHAATATAGRRPTDRRLAPFLPWAEPRASRGRWWPTWRRLPRTAPFLVGYLAISWLLFLPQAEPAPGNVVIDAERVRPFLYAIPDLDGNTLLALASLLTAPWLNHNLVQLVYVTALLLLFGLPFEAREGSLRTAAIFFGTTFAGAVCAGVLLQALYPEPWGTPFAERAWERTWSGGSAGAFGLMGALAARARVPWPLLGLFVLWEANVVWWYLREYTPAFHLSALLVGFLVVRFALPPRRDAAPGRPTAGVE